MDTKDLVILDVRTPEEFQGGHVKGSINIDFYAPDFKDSLAALDKNKNYVLYCRSGNRSGQAANFMKQIGFKMAENLGSVEEASMALKIPCVK